MSYFEEILITRCILKWNLRKCHHFDKKVVNFRCPVHITMTSQWTRWLFKSPASRLFTQRFVQAHRWPEHSPLKGPVTQKMFPFDDAIMHPVAQTSSIWRHFHFDRCLGGISLLLITPISPQTTLWETSEALNASLFHTMEIRISDHFIWIIFQRNQQYVNMGLYYGLVTNRRRPIIHWFS